MGRSETHQVAELLLEQLQLEAGVLSYEEIESINNVLKKATLLLHRVHNDRSPIFKFPAEILQKILELVPEPCTKRWRGFRPFWRNTLLDSSMLIPVTHTCRRRCEVALAHPHLWTTFQISFKRLPLIQQMAMWSEHIPLNVAGHDFSLLEELPPNTRLGSIHLYNIREDDLGLLPTVIGHTSSPALHSFSLFRDQSQRWHTDSKRDPLPLFPEHAPNLCFLTLDEVEFLPNKGFSCLTHLALTDSIGYTISLRNGFLRKFHARLFEFLKASLRLESIVLIGLCLFLGGNDVPVREPAPLPLCHLRHVTLRHLSTSATKHYTSLLQPPVDGSSVSILGFNLVEPLFLGRFLLPPDSNAPRTLEQICIGVHPMTPDSRDYAISVTTVFSRSTRHLTTWSSEVFTDSEDWPSSIRVLHQHPASPSPLHADEVWLYGVSANVPARRSSPLMHLPHAARVVVAIDLRLHYHDVPTLRLLPSVHGQLPGTIAITTLRLVHGFSESDEPFHEPSKFDPDPETKYRLPLGQLHQQKGKIDG